MGDMQRGTYLKLGDRPLAESFDLEIKASAIISRILEDQNVAVCFDELKTLRQSAKDKEKAPALRDINNMSRKLEKLFLKDHISETAELLALMVCDMTAEDIKTSTRKEAENWLTQVFVDDKLSGFFTPSVALDSEI